MKLPLAKLVFAFAVIGLFSMPALADALPAEGCNASVTLCVAIEGQTLSYGGGIAISGDVLLTGDGSLTGILDGLFRINNDLFDSGGGTGLGLDAFLFGPTTGLPSPPFSVNDIAIVFGQDNGTGIPLLNVPGYIETEFVGNGTTYELFTTPEPASWQLLAIALFLVVALGFARKRFGQVNA